MAPIVTTAREITGATPATAESDLIQWRLYLPIFIFNLFLPFSAIQ
jgi:hypothetical protein